LELTNLDFSQVKALIPVIEVFLHSTPAAVHVITCITTNQPNNPFHSHYSGQPALAGNSSEDLEDFVGAKFYCPHALADSNQRIQIREKTLEFSSTVLSIGWAKKAGPQTHDHNSVKS